MATPDLTKFTGEQLFEYYTGEGGEYASTLSLAYVEIGDKLFPMLEKAEKEDKKVKLTEDMDDVLDSPISITIE